MSEPFAALAGTIEPGSRLLRTWELKGGVSAQLTALELERPDGSREKLVVRRHGAADGRWNPQIAADEFRLLEVLNSAGIPAPRPRLPYEDGLVVDYIDGEPARADEPDLVAELAAVLVEIHRADVVELSFLPARELSSRNRSVLLHGDFWPGNTLWRDGRLVGVIDWEDAAIGDPLADLANARLEVLWASSIEAMHELTRRYAAMTAVDLADLPRWDLWADRRLTPRIAEWGLDPAGERAMRAGREAFVRQALERLGET
jgi:aminoglycoside phosphotransferase (APT) family kinase protein